MDRSKAQNRIDPRDHRLIARLLRRAARHRENTDLHVASSDDVAEALHRIDGLPAGRPHLRGRIIERRDDVDPVVFKSLVAEDRSSEPARADDDGVGPAVIA